MTQPPSPSTAPPSRVAPAAADAGPAPATPAAEIDADPPDDAGTAPAAAPDDADADADADAARHPAGRARFPIVGIGASAGGLAAFEEFFSALPSQGPPGLALVLVQHLAPDHPSILASIIARFTRLPVSEAINGTRVEVNHVYVIPPNGELEIHDGVLHLQEPAEARGHRLPIDGFFRSLAQDRGESAMAVVLSGTGSDGAQGVRAIKAQGGIVLVQSILTAEFSGMPRAALETGAADHELSPQEMPARLLAYAAQGLHRSVRAGAPVGPAGSALLKKIFELLRAQTGHDFAHYKSSTVYRRLHRRMSLHQIETPDSYVAYLQRSSDEVQTLFRELLIGVTQFFRDADSFLALEKDAIPALLARRAPGQALRVWVAGCSTGEEAYSIAMLLLELLDEPASPEVLQIFATDIDSRAIASARAGLYPAGIARDISADRLARHFTEEPDGAGYRIRKRLRDLLIFSEHDLTRDPPFSRMDLISCRNLLIYLDATLQKRIIPLFHYALKPDGTLFLGTSESTGEFERLFWPINRRAKLFRRLEDLLERPRAALNQMRQPVSIEAGRPTTPLHIAMSPPKPSLRELTERAILRGLPVAAALVNGQGDILYLHGRTGAYLEPAPGEASISNILAMAREGLRRELSLALAQALASRGPVIFKGVPVKTNGHYTAVNLRVNALEAGIDPAVSPLLLVMLEEAPPVSLGAPPATPVADTPTDQASDARVAALTQALRISEEQMQALHEELESSIEELKSANEDMQSVNEELQSTNEELETSKEELQSLNEELSTVNAELESKVAYLSRANDDMNNLLAGTGIATVFVNHSQHILRFTPGAGEIINLIASDVGRPVGHLASNLEGYDNLSADTQSVLDTLIPKEHDVRTRAGRWFSLRIQPYRTIDNVIEGAVITFSDISDSMRTRMALDRANEVLRLMIVERDSTDAVVMHDLDGRTLSWNQSAMALYGWSEPEALALNFTDRLPPEQRAGALADLQQWALAETRDQRPTKRLTKDNRQLDVMVKATALQDARGVVYAIASAERLTSAPRPS